MYLLTPSRKHGQAIIELALLMPLFLLVVVAGILEFGLIFYNAITLQQIANNVAQYAAEATPSPDSSGYYSRIDSIANECNYQLAKQRSKLALAYSSELTDQYRTIIVKPTDPDGQVTVPEGGIVKTWKITIEFKSPLLTPLYSYLAGVLSDSGNPYFPLRARAIYPVD